MMRPEELLGATPLAPAGPPAKPAFFAAARLVELNQLETSGVRTSGIPINKKARARRAFLFIWRARRDCAAHPCAAPFGPPLRGVQNRSRRFCRTVEPDPAPHKPNKKPARRPVLCLARPERFELPTAWFVARYSIQLSYGRIVNRRGIIQKNHLSSFPHRNDFPLISTRLAGQTSPWQTARFS